MKLRIRTDVYCNHAHPDDGLLISRTGLNMPYTSDHYEKLLQKAIRRCDEMFASTGNGLNWITTDGIDCNLLIRLYLGDEQYLWMDMWQDYLIWVDNNPDNMPPWDLCLVCVPAVMQCWYNTNGDNGKYPDFDSYLIDKIAEAMYWGVLAPKPIITYPSRPWWEDTAS